MSSSESKTDLESQKKRLLDYAAARGYQVSNVITEVGSGINDTRKQWLSLQQDRSIRLIVVEQKERDFRSPTLSGRMNRLISWFGKSYVQQKLKSLTEMLGLTITEGNPAYSSQECSVCGYVDKANRTAQAIFQCQCCNNGIHADVNATRNHLGRSFSGVIDVYKSTETVLRILTERFLSHAERIPRLYGKRESLLPANPYFRGYPAQLKGFS